VWGGDFHRGNVTHRTANCTGKPSYLEPNSDSMQKPIEGLSQAKLGQKHYLSHQKTLENNLPSLKVINLFFTASATFTSNMKETFISRKAPSKCLAIKLARNINMAAAQPQPKRRLALQE